jgi:hypothetical protein
MGTHARNCDAPRWSRGDHDAAFHLWRDGERVELIGERVGRTKNAVISRAHRKGFGPHPYGHDPRHAL